MNGHKKVMHSSNLRITSRPVFRSRWAGGLLGVAVAAGLFSSGCAKEKSVEAAPTVTVQVGSAENQTIDRKVVAEATLYPLEQAAIVPKVTAPVKKFYVEKGDIVHAGQLLAELENSDLLAQKQENEGAYTQAQAGYDEASQK